MSFRDDVAAGARALEGSRLLMERIPAHPGAVFCHCCGERRPRPASTGWLYRSMFGALRALCPRCGDVGS